MKQVQRRCLMWDFDGDEGRGGTREAQYLRYVHHLEPQQYGVAAPWKLSMRISTL